VTRRFLKIMLELVFLSDSVASIKNQRAKIHNTATVIAKLIFIQYVLLHITEDTVRRALAYNLFKDIIFWVNLIISFNEALKWRDEISLSFHSRFEKIWEKTHYIFDSKFGFLTIPLQFVAILSYDLYRFLASYLIRLDI